ncbi:hypothetical protein OH76DRAFT_1407764 [Lentinus brumalis]|uniref:Secreted protein n=1 Tax=Lentinus brumalis TaxID=2498619 RepID=A0A371CZS3_9APHY|nr:hypothetical protein OH76DRAFT_1407764 [Polyporus brumalis]
MSSQRCLLNVQLLAALTPCCRSSSTSLVDCCDVLRDWKQRTDSWQPDIVTSICPRCPRAVAYHMVRVRAVQNVSTSYHIVTDRAPDPPRRVWITARPSCPPVPPVCPSLSSARPSRLPVPLVCPSLSSARLSRLPVPLVCPSLSSVNLIYPRVPRSAGLVPSSVS